MDLEGLKPAFLPPPYVKPPETNQSGISFGRGLVYCILSVGVFLAGYYLSTGGQHQRLPFTPTIFVDQERVTLASFHFLVATGTYRPNFWYTKWHIDGNINNIAGHTNVSIRRTPIVP
jgi:hypothetical protein